MAAITTDTHHQLPPFVARPRSAQVLPHHPVRPVQGGQPLVPADAAVRVLLAVAAVVVVLAVAVGTAALGRVLDGQRGIPVDPVAATSVG